MQGYLSLVLHAHLPFVRHPEHERFLEESWLFEAITETYIPMLQALESWEQDRLPTRLTMSLSPTLCCMLADPLLQTRYRQRLEEWIELAEKETQRNHWEPSFSELAQFYYQRLSATRAYYESRKGDLLGVFRQLQDRNRLEIMASAATHGLLPLLAEHPPSLRAQVLVGRDDYRRIFGCDPRGFWLPECAYSSGLGPALQEANIRWFIVDTHGVLQARPRPRAGVFAPVLTPEKVAAFGRDRDSAREVWSREEGYPGDGRYRDFYRDIGFDLEFDYVGRHLPAPGQRGFTGLKYYRITDRSNHKQLYQRSAALEAARQHAEHFVKARMRQLQALAARLEHPPIMVCPYDAELFGHWWYEGPEFLDTLVRMACQTGSGLALTTPEDYLEQHSKLQLATPNSSSWGAQGYWGVWLDESNQWIYPHLRIAQERMTELAGRSCAPGVPAERAIKQAARELLLAQASDWPFLLRSGTSSEYARQRVKGHLLRFTGLYEQLRANQIDPLRLEELEKQDNIFPEVNYRYWASS